ncbi:NADH dehydrogenase (ubiquinone) subunit ND-42 isoform X2 [Dermatophagoides farinae]|uniref:NADH dehydrogenase [ubiquinone] 1 alpha subcomplex subunit 10, mitochondrial n=1 Tax=Dermatophagoides farinae TaxID=6954 RepID=A0A9D4P8A8_DERFA|nr:NADH dehydrogenase [ubiquinone] 1 alpha subcomplex subunit 10, mitochondrial-like [Dermatophagoides farinae]KAH7645777.1 nadh dehydrogenase [Dermatophagoides farinae]
MSGALRLSILIRSSFLGKNHLKQLPAVLSNHRVANIVSVANQTPEDGFIKTTPFPFKTKRYTRLHVAMPFLDPTEVRMNKNSKIICVEGNIGSKKDQVAEGIAKAFGMHYMPEPRIDEMYVNKDGFDYRTLNQYIHPKLHAIDEKMYYEDPYHPAVPWLKIFFYKIRYMQYVDALAHMFNSGQGVVLERAPQSDFVFADAMHKCGFLPKDAYDHYYRLRYDTIHELKRPHLVIYLDTDVDVCMRRIKEKGIPYQINSKVLCEEYLSEIEKSYKEKYLEDADKYSQLLVFKWNEPTPLDDMILAMENVNLDDWDIFGDKFRDWNFYFNSIMHEARYTYTREKNSFISAFSDTLTYDVDSLDLDANDYEHRDKVYETLVPNYGQVPETGLKNGFLKSAFTLPSLREKEEFCIRGPFF